MDIAKLREKEVVQDLHPPSVYSNDDPNNRLVKHNVLDNGILSEKLYKVYHITFSKNEKALQVFSSSGGPISEDDNALSVEGDGECLSYKKESYEILHHRTYPAGCCRSILGCLINGFTLLDIISKDWNHLHEKFLKTFESKKTLENTSERLYESCTFYDKQHKTYCLACSYISKGLLTVSG